MGGAADSAGAAHSAADGAERPGLPVRTARRRRLFRDVNDRILRLTAAAPPNDIAFVCECSSLECSTLIPMSREEYRFVRLESLCFVIVPDHLDEEVERVVEATARYLIVEKNGVPGEGSDESEGVLRRHRARARNDARA